MSKVKQRDIMLRAVGAEQLADTLDLSGKTLTLPASLILAGDFTGDLTGDVTGNVTGNVAGNVAGNLTGNVTGNVTGNIAAPGDSSFAGYVTTPGMPAFHAQTITEAVPNNDVSGYQIVFNRGNGLNATNGRFTAPVAGVYFFRYNQMTKFGETGAFWVSLCLNGNTLGYGGLNFPFQKTAVGYYHVHAHGHISMNVNDYVTVFYASGASNLTSEGRLGSFSGHFVG